MLTAQPPPSALPADAQEVVDMFMRLYPETRKMVLERLRELVHAQETYGQWGKPWDDNTDPQFAEGERSA